MVFSSITFLFYFLPLAIGIYFIAPKRARNLVLLSFSIIFYTWGEIEYVTVMILSIMSNYVLGRLIANSNRKHVWLVLAVIVNLGLLVFFKYTNFLIDNLNPMLELLHVTPITQYDIHLPIGISFFTFQALSYVVDVYRGTTEVQKNPLDLALYISLFPQLIAGPIVRYKDVAEQLKTRIISRGKFAEGIQRFVTGLAKKILIANNMAIVADKIFPMTPEQLSTPLAWLGIIAYTLQIYFDFSGYSDMAIGLGKIFGFDFLENFNYPYIAQSIQDFWRRWHISLSNWFRDYLYIPLGGNRKGLSRTYINLYIVFFLTGLWHGASWNFIFWGVWHGTFLVIERIGFIKVLNRAWQPLRHLYTVFVFLFGWVFFRAITFNDALDYIQRMVFWSEGNGYRTIPIIMNNELWLALIFGIILSAPVLKHSWVQRLRQVDIIQTIEPIAVTLTVIALMYLSVINLAGSTYNPFIYFRF